MLVKFYIVLLLGVRSIQHLLPYSLLNQTITAQFQGLSDFTIDLMNFSGNKKFLIFGGMLRGSPQNTLIEIYLHNKSATLHNTTTIPPARSQHCALVYEYKYYVYGGIDENGRLLSDLWEFNTIFKTWSHLSTSTRMLSKCKIVKNHTSIVVLGVNGRRELSIVGYSLVRGEWNDSVYYYGSSVTIEGKMYEGSVKQTLLSIEQIPAINSSLANIHFVNQISTTNLQILPMDPAAGTYYLLTDTKITAINLHTLNIFMIRNLKSIQNNYHALISDQWLFLLQSSTQGVLMEYYRLQDFNIVGMQSYSNPEPSFTYQPIIYDGDIFLVSQATMDTWQLAEHCEWDVNYTHISSCFYNKIHCQDGYFGELCQIRSCPNTLVLFDPTKQENILYQCSNHGNCTEAGCQCEPNWGGEDCSTYMRKSCNGELVDNWPVLNCQCNQQTTGGNSCEVKFCYNDCTGHGKCLQTGRCECFTGFYGEDCSITIIQFPTATLSI